MSGEYIMTKVITDIVTDVDGVFTDGTFVYSPEGKVYKTFGPHDGDAIKLIRDICDVKVTAISADHRGFSITKARMDDMGIPVFPVSEKDRFDWISQNFNWDTILFVGDGMFDARALRRAKYGIAPRGAVNISKLCADYVTEANGGEGVFLEVLAKVIELNEIDMNIITERLGLENE